jgi:hypothetical protein
MKIVEFGTIECTEDGRLTFHGFIMDKARPTPKDVLSAVIEVMQEALDDLESQPNG